MCAYKRLSAHMAMEARNLLRMGWAVPAELHCMARPGSPRVCTGYLPRLFI